MPVTLLEACDWWHDAFGAGAPYGDLDTPTVLSNLAHRGAHFAEVVYALEQAMPHPNVDVLTAAEARIEAA